ERGEHRCERTEPIGPQPVDVLRPEGAEVAVDGVDHDRERDVRLELRGAAGQGQATAGAGRTGELVEQPRLADARLPGDDDAAPVATDRFVECRSEYSELGVSTYRSTRC